MLINETQLPHLKITSENLNRHIAAAKKLATCSRDGLWITITYNEQKGYEGDLFRIPGLGLVVLTGVRVYDFRELNRMALDTYEQEGFKNPRDYLSELVRLYKGIPETFFVHTFLEINRSEND